MVIGYARVSTDQQATEAQLLELRNAGCRRVYHETAGGSTLDRPELGKCLDRLDPGDTLVVWRLDRLGRSIRDLLQIVDRLDKNGVPLYFPEGGVRHEHRRRQADLSRLCRSDPV